MKYKRWRQAVRLVFPSSVLLVFGLALLMVAGSRWNGEAGVVSDPTRTPVPLPTPTSWPRQRMASPEYGMQVFLWWNEQAAARDLALVHDAGFGWIKQNVGWRDVEKGEGAYDWYFTDRIVDDAQRLGLNVLFRIDHEPVWTVPPEGDSTGNGPPADAQDLGDFCHVLAERYRGRVAAYQVWNEPNLAREWGGHPPDPARYVELLRACYIGVKTADPGALVISAGLAPTGNGLPEALPDTDYLIGMYEAGAAPYFDLLGLHAPGFAYPPEASPDDVAAERNGHRFFCFRHVEDMRAIMERFGDADKQVAILEFGWTTDPGHNPDYAWYAVTPEQQAEYLVGAYRYAREHWSPWIGLMTALSIPDPDWPLEDEKYWWAITEPWPSSETRPAYEALRDMEK